MLQSASDIESDIYESTDALDAYLASVRAVREERKSLRAACERIADSIERVSIELELSRGDGDEDIAETLAAVLAEFERRQKEAQRRLIPAQPATLAVAADRGPQTACQAGNAERVAPPGANEPDGDRSNAPTLTPTEISPAAAVDEAVPTAADRTPAAAESPVEQPLAHAWREELSVLAQQVSDIENSADRHACRSALLRLRALACSAGAVHAAARAYGPPVDVAEDMRDLRARIDFVRDVEYSDTLRPLPFDEAYWSADDRCLGAEEWRGLAELYVSTADAQEALDWYAANVELLDRDNKLRLLNCVGARQQMLYRALNDHNSTDRLQGDMFGAVRDAGSRVDYLDSLDGHTSQDELVSFAAGLRELLEQCQREATTTREKRDKEARRASAIKAVVRWHAEQEERGEEADADTRDILLPLLDVCAANGVPASNPQVRSALLDHAPRLLAGLPAYDKFLEAVAAERKRRGLDEIDAAPPDEGSDAEVSDDQLEEWRGAVARYAANKSVLLLGGTPKPRICEELQRAVMCAAVAWPPSKRGDRASKFEAQIKRADLVIVAKNFASHEITTKAREWARELGKPYVLLPSGYGVRQIINQLYQQVVRTA